MYALSGLDGDSTSESYSVRPWCVLSLLIVYITGCGTDPKLPALPLRSAPQQCFAHLDSDQQPPALLSASGCFSSVQTHTFSPDVIPYGVNSALWTDGADKHRYMVIPLEEQIHVDVQGVWQFPSGSLLIKEFGFIFDDADPASKRIVETRFMQITGEAWRFFSYRWRDDSSDADLVQEQQIGNFTLIRDDKPRIVNYLFPNEEACTYCHSDAAHTVLGPTNEQLNGVFDYGHRKAEQIDALIEAGYVDEQAFIDLESLPKLPDPMDTRVPIEQRAKSYLHANCAHCHRPGGWTSPNLRFDLRYTTAFNKMGICNEPSRSVTAYAYPVLFVPGDPEQSALLARIDPESDIDRMPPLGVSVTDPLAVELVREWISTTQSCP